MRRDRDDRRHLLALAVLSNAARSPFANFRASSFAQKCMKNSLGCSVSMWLWIAVTSIPFVRNALITGVDLLANEHEVARDRSLAAAARLEVDPRGDPGRAWRNK